jgi:RNA polymerase sigma-70 factor (ECF subfamily)
MANHDKSETGWDSFEQLLQAARKGDRNAMNQIIDECRDYLLLVANQEIETAIQAKLGASDLVQQSLAEIPGHLAQFRGNSRDEFLGWLRQILMNDLHDVRRHYKTSRRRDVSREQSILDSVGNERPITDNLLTPSSQAIQDEQAQILQRAMAQLSPRQHHPAAQLVSQIVRRYRSTTRN